MLTLSLLRHAKSSWDDPDLPDRDRPLGKRGARDAPRMGVLIRSRQLIPDLVLCSPAIRTRATLALIAPHLTVRDAQPIAVYDDELYLAEPSVLLARLGQIAVEAGHVLLIGHNPGLHALALTVVRAGEPRAVARLAQGFPTCALATIDIDAEAWDDVATARGTLRLFTTPKDLR